MKVLKEYRVKDTIYLRDKGLAFSGQDDRFEELNKVEYQRVTTTKLMFQKDEVVKGAERTEVGQWLLRRDKLIGI